jgi:hypothetical protein
MAEAVRSASPWTEARRGKSQVFHFKVPLNMPSRPAVFAWIWLNREHESFMNCASVQIGAGSGRNTTPVDPSSTADSIMYYTALPTPTGEVPTERERHRSGDCDQNLTSRNISGDASVTGSRWNRIKHRHSRKHARYYYCTMCAKLTHIHHLESSAAGQTVWLLMLAIGTPRPEWILATTPRAPAALPTPS